MKLSDLFEVKQLVDQQTRDALLFWLGDSRKDPQKAIALILQVAGKIPEQLRRSKGMLHRSTIVDANTAALLLKGNTIQTQMRQVSSFAEKMQQHILVSLRKMARQLSSTANKFHQER